MNIPQVKSTLASILIILFGAPIAGAYFSWQMGELHDWQGLWISLSHGAFGAVMLACGWLLLRSPFAGKFTELLQTKTTAQGEQTTTKLTISEPAAIDPMEAKPNK